MLDDATIFDVIETSGSEALSEQSSDRPLVSIVITNYNYGQYLQGCVRSSWNQTYRPLEVIVVDDGSIDGSPSLLRQLAVESPIPMRVILQENRGVAAATQVGVAASQGAYVALLDADDEFRPDKTDFQVAEALKDQAITLVHCEVTPVDEAGME